MARQHTRFFHSKKQWVERYVWEGCNFWGVAPWGQRLPPAALADHSSAEPNNQTRGEIQRVSHRTRNIVERSFGVLKSRFRCLDTSGGSLFYSPTKVCRVTVAVAVLHNMCIKNGVPIPADCVDARDRWRIGRPQYIGPINDDLLKFVHVSILSYWYMFLIRHYSLIHV